MTRLGFLLMMATVAWCGPVVAQTKPLPPDLAQVPGDALAVLHVKLTDVWKHNLMNGMRDTIAAAGEKARTAFDKQVYPSPATLDRLTVFVLPARPFPEVFGIVRFNEPIDTAKFFKLHMPKAEQAPGGVHIDAESEIGLRFLDPQHLLIGRGSDLVNLKDRPAVKKGAITQALELAATGPAIVLAGNAKAIPIPPDAKSQIPENIQPLLEADRVLVTVDLVDDPKVNVRLQYAGERLAGEAEEAVKAAISMAKVGLSVPRQQMQKALFDNADKGHQPIEKYPELFGSLVGLGGMKQLDDFLKNPPLKRDGNDLTMSFTVSGNLYTSGAVAAVGVGLLLPAVQKVREAAARAKGSNNLKQIMLAMHAHHDAMQGFPAAAICDKAGKPLLSWRVAILPYIEQENLYREFKLDEPWDSAHNKKLLPRMPQIYACPRAPLAPGQTIYKAFVGKDAALHPTKLRRIAEMTDGTSNTLCVIEGGTPVEWTKPEDITFDPTKPLLAQLALPGGESTVQVGLCDGSVRALRLPLYDTKEIRRFVTINDGEIVDWKE